MPKTIDGYRIVKKQKDADAVYDSVFQDFVAFAPGGVWSLSRSKWLRETGTGHWCYYVEFSKSQRDIPYRVNP